MLGIFLLLIGIGTALLGIIGLVACLITLDASAFLPNLGILVAGLVIGTVATAILE
jgi:hypothetical protein